MISNLVRTEVSAMSMSDLDNLVQVIQARRQQLNAGAAMTFNIGDHVAFKGKRDRIVTGTIMRLMRGGKFEIGSCSDGYTWRYPAAMLRRIT